MAWYSCPKCGANGSADDWDNANATVNGRWADKLEKDLPYGSYTCPFCNDSVDGDEFIDKNDYFDG